ncbi:MAG: hypothetical protein JEZ08_22590 [Clostridiales bacterium]|nr:hypothetical protein [Clostridiales bacterium]
MNFLNDVCYFQEDDWIKGIELIIKTQKKDGKRLVLVVWGITNLENLQWEESL